METWYQVAVLSVGGVLGVNAALLVGGCHQPLDRAAIPVGNLDDQRDRIVRDRAFHSSPGSLAPPSSRPAAGRGWLPGGIHHFFIVLLRIVGPLGARRARALPHLHGGQCRGGVRGSCPGHGAGRGLTVPAAERATRGDRTAVDSDGRVWTAPGRDRAAPPTLADDPGPPPTRPGPRESVSAADEPGASS